MEPLHRPTIEIGLFASQSLSVPQSLLRHVALPLATVAGVGRVLSSGECRRMFLYLPVITFIYDFLLISSRGFEE